MKKILLAFSVLLAPIICYAGDLGKIGTTYPIAEQDMLAYIQKKLNAMKASGEIDRIQQYQKQKILASIEKGPPPVEDLRPAKEGRSYWVDPTWTLDHDIYDHEGRLLYKSGTKVNPLDYVTLSQRMVFFDATNERQHEWAKQYINDPNYRLVLVNGSPIKLMRQWRTQIYYDQYGMLTNRFGLTETPAIVSQEGKKLRVDVVALEK